MNDQPFHRKILIALGITLPVVLMILLLGAVFKVLLLILAGVLVAIGISALAGRIHSIMPVVGGWSKLIAVVLFLGLTVGAVALMAPSVAEQFAQLKEDLPSTLENVRSQLEGSRFGSTLVDQLPDDPQAFLERHAGLVKKSFGVFSTTFGVIGDIYVILMLSLYFVLSPDPYRKGIVSLVQKEGRIRMHQVLDKIHLSLENWLKGKLISMALVGILTAIALWIMGIPMALTLSLLAGILCFIPNFGPLLAMVPAVLVASLQGPQMALNVILVYTAIQFVEGSFITPKIQERMVNLPLAMIMIAQVTLGMLTGALGLILATPIIVIILQLVNMLYVEDVLGGGVEDPA